MTFIARRPVFCVLTWQSLEQVAVGGGLALSAHEWLLQRLGAAIAQHDMLLSLCGLYDHGKGVFNYRESGQFGQTIVSLASLAAACERFHCTLLRVQGGVHSEAFT